jgi:hypothetical protein
MSASRDLESSLAYAGPVPLDPRSREHRAWRALCLLHISLTYRPEDSLWYASIDDENYEAETSGFEDPVVARRDSALSPPPLSFLPHLPSQE